MLIKVPVWVNSVLRIYPSYGPWKSLKSPWIWFWQTGKKHVCHKTLHFDYMLSSFLHRSLCQPPVKSTAVKRGDWNRLASVYHTTHVPRRTRRRVQSWTEDVTVYGVRPTVLVTRTQSTAEHVVKYSLCGTKKTHPHFFVITSTTLDRFW